VCFKKGCWGRGGITETEKRGEITERLWVSFMKSVTCPHCMALVMDEGIKIDDWWNVTDNRKL